MYLISVLKHTHTCSEREKETGRQTQGQTKDRKRDFKWSYTSWDYNASPNNYRLTKSSVLGMESLTLSSNIGKGGPPKEYQDNISYCHCL